MMLRKEKSNETLKLMCLLTTWCGPTGESESRRTERELSIWGKQGRGLVKALLILQGSPSFLTIRIRH